MTDAITPDVVEHLQQWQGKTEQLTEFMAPQPLLRLAATLECPSINATPGSAIPPLWHWTTFTPLAAQSELGHDGHPKLGGFMPPVPLPRRMWAGGRLHWHGQLQLGDMVEKTTTIQSIKHKAGRSGDLVFALLVHEYRQQGALVLREEQDVVYRAPAKPGDPVPAPTPAPTDPAWSKTVTPSSTMLFRYSALTFNSHRIHYDRPYAMQEEGYGGLVVHGPLLATFLGELLRENMPQANIASFSFRAVRPTLDTHPFMVCGKLAEDGQSATMWSQDHEGWLTMQAEVTFG